MIYRHARPVSVVVGLLAWLLAASSASAFMQPRIVNGEDSHDYPTTGHLLYAYGEPINDGNQSSWCSGTLIGCSTFLTAAHCVVDDPNPAHYRVFLQHAGVFNVASVTRHPSYLDESFPNYDVAVLKLAQPATAIDPTEINSSLSPAFGSIGTIVGFGQTNGVAGDYGIKRAGLVTTIDCTSLAAGLTNNEVVCWRFSSPLGPPGSNSNSCNGDSGGPLFVNVGGGDVVAGVTSGGFNSSCLPTDYSYDANVFTHRSFITSQLGTDSTAPCGGLPAVGSPGVLTEGSSGFLDETGSSVTTAINVVGSPAELRFVLNGENPGFDVDLYVKKGLDVSTTNFDCKDDSYSNFGDCVFTAPSAGTWTVLVRRFSGTGQYQLTTTVVGGEPAVCGNGLNEVGEECDGGDDAACPGGCNAACACPCEEETLVNVKIRANGTTFRFKEDLVNVSGVFTGIDPRNEFAFGILQGANVVSLELPPGDDGWANSRPEKKKYIWKGSVDGFTRVRIIDKTTKKGFIRIVIKGKNVPGASAIDTSRAYEVQNYFDLACNRRVL